jgi:hypothetical protein
MRIVQSFQFADYHKNWKIKHAELPLALKNCHCRQDGKQGNQRR